VACVQIAGRIVQAFLTSKRTPASARDHLARSDPEDIDKLTIR
jgi:hypothetical protein